MGTEAGLASSVHVNSTNEATQKVTSLGGKVVHAPMPIPTWAAHAIIRRIRRAPPFPYISPERFQRRDSRNAEHPAGSRWNELMDHCYRRAFDFYRQLFGWEKTGRKWTWAAASMYVMFGMKGKPFGGIFNASAASMPNMRRKLAPVHLCQRREEDCRDGNACRAVFVRRGPMDIPGGIIAIPRGPAGSALRLAPRHVRRQPPRRAAKPKAQTKSGREESSEGEKEHGETEGARENNNAQQSHRDTKAVLVQGEGEKKSEAALVRPVSRSPQQPDEQEADCADRCHEHRNNDDHQHGEPAAAFLDCRGLDGVALEQFDVADVGLERDVKEIAEHGDRAERGVHRIGCRACARNDGRGAPLLAATSTM